MRELKRVLYLNLLIFTILLHVIMAAYSINDPLRPFFYSIWSISMKEPAVPLITLSIILTATFLLVLFLPKKLKATLLLFQPVEVYGESKNIIDRLICWIIIILLSIFLLLNFLQSLNAGLSSFYPVIFSFMKIPPISISNPFIGLVAFILILSKGYLLQMIIYPRGEGDLLKQISLTVGLGFGVTSIQIMILGILNRLYPNIVIISDLLIFTGLLMITVYRLTGIGFREKDDLLGPVIKDRIFSWKERINRSSLYSIYRRPWKILIIILIVIFLITGTYWSLPAVVEWDSLAYIVYFAKIIYERHGIPVISGPSIGLEMSAAYPTGFQSLGIYIYEYIGESDDFYFRVLTPIFFILTLISIYIFSREIFPNLTHRLTVLLLVVSTPVLYLYLIASGHYTGYLVFLTTCFLNLLLRYIKTGSKRELFTASLLSGFTSIITYMGLMNFLTLGIVILIRERKDAFTPRVISSASAGIIMPIWYLFRNLIFLHDPLYPYLSSSNDILWAARESHFYLMSIYTGLQLGSLFSIEDFLLMRTIGVRPWMTIAILILPIILLYMYKTGSLKRLRRKEKYLFLLFLLALGYFLVNSRFERYLLPYIAVFSCIFVWIMKAMKKLRLYRSLTAMKILVVYSIVTLILSVSFTTTLPAALMGPDAVTWFKPAKADALDYLEYFYGGDALVWRWLNENVAPGDKVASYEIRYYYIKPTIVNLDSSVVSFLYEDNMTVEEAIERLQRLNIKYILTTAWASSMSNTFPDLYKRNIILKYLGDPQYFPGVYARSTTAVYHVGKMNISEVIKEHLNHNIIPPILKTKMETEIVITNKTKPPTARLYLHVPCDFHDKVRLTIKTTSNPYNISIELWRGEINESRGWWKTHKAITSSPWPARPAIDPKLYWRTTGGTFTIIIRLWDKYHEPIPIHVLIYMDVLKP